MKILAEIGKHSIRHGQIYAHYKTNTRYIVEVIGMSRQDVAEDEAVNGFSFRVGTASAPFQQGDVVIGYSKYIATDSPNFQAEMDTNKVWFQSRTRFFEVVDKEGVQMPRFVLVSREHEERIPVRTLLIAFGITGAVGVFIGIGVGKLIVAIKENA